MISSDKIDRPQLAAALQAQQPFNEIRAALTKLTADSAGRRMMVKIRNCLAQISGTANPLHEIRRTMQTQIALANTLLRSRRPSAIVTQILRDQGDQFREPSAAATPNIRTPMLNPMPAKLASLRDAFQPFNRALTESLAQPDVRQSLSQVRTALGKFAKSVPKFSLPAAIQCAAGEEGRAAMKTLQSELAALRALAKGEAPGDEETDATRELYHKIRMLAPHINQLARAGLSIGAPNNRLPAPVLKDIAQTRQMTEQILAHQKRNGSNPPVATWGE